MYFGHDRLQQDALCKFLLLDEHICITKHFTTCLSSTDEDFDDAYLQVRLDLRNFYKRQFAREETIVTLAS